jgi:hypothetical protein
MINDLPTVFEVVIEREKDNGKSNSGNSGSKTKTSGKVRSFSLFENTKIIFFLQMFVIWHFL